MLITELRLQRKKTRRQELKAECNIIINNCVQIGRMNIIERNGRTSLEMPSINDYEGHFKNVFFPINSGVRTHIEEIIASGYSGMLENDDNYLTLSLVNKDTSCFENQTFHDFGSVVGNMRDREYDNNLLGSISVTDIRLRKNDRSDRLAAFASVVLDSSFVMSDMKVIHNPLNDGYILSMPTYQTQFNRYHEIYHPINKAFRMALEKLVFDAFFQMNAANANIFSASVIVPKIITEQNLSDFECICRTLDNTDLEKGKSIEIPHLESLGDEQDEMFYTNPSSIFKYCLDSSQNIVFGKIVSYSQDGYYNVRLNNKKSGVVPTIELDSLHKVVDYQDYILSTYKTKAHKESDPILQHIGVEYAFEIIRKKDDSTVLLGFAEAKKQYLKYLIENQIILKGVILEIDKTHVSIEIPFGYVFITTPVRLFGYKCDEAFVYTDYLNCVVSIVLEYDKDKNKLYPVLYNQKCGTVTYNGKYVFPYTYTWINGTKNTKLWLDKPLTLDDKHQRYLQKFIGEMFVVSNLREKGINQSSYKGNIKYKIDKATMVEKVRKNILGVQWLVNLKGQKMRDVEDYLESKGFVWEVDYIYSQNVEKDIVMSMVPDLHEKTILPCNTIISLKVSKGAKNKYVIPNFVGMNINMVRKELSNHNIKSKVTYSDIYTESVSENTVLETVPSSGSIRYNDQTIKLIVYSSQKWSLPFELLETDTILNTTQTVMNCNAPAFETMISMSWKKDIITFLLGHRLAVSKDLVTLTRLLHPTDYKYNRIMSFLDKLQDLGLVDTYKVSDGVRTLHSNFFAPTKLLYDLARNQMDYRDKYKRYQINSVFCKTRASENITFLKLVEILGLNYLPEYKVDWLNSINPTENVGRIKIHFAVHFQKKSHSHIYILESIRRTDEGTIDKMKRYQQMFSYEKKLPITLILVFPDLRYKEEFLEVAFNNIYFDNIRVLSTTDKLVCDDALTDFDSVFTKEDGLCTIIY